MHPVGGVNIRHNWGKERGGNLQKERGFTHCAVIILLILCVSVSAATFVWRAYP